MPAMRTLTFIEVATPPTAGGQLIAPWPALPAAMKVALTRTAVGSAVCEAAGCTAAIGWAGAVWIPLTLVNAANKWGAAVAVCASCSPAAKFAAA
jgi:hypothetical protein